MLREITPKLVGKQENKQKIKSKAMRHFPSPTNVLFRR